MHCATLTWHMWCDAMCGTLTKDTLLWPQALANAAFDVEGRPMLLDMNAIPEFVRSDPLPSRFFLSFCCFRRFSRAVCALVHARRAVLDVFHASRALSAVVQSSRAELSAIGVLHLAV